jgi:hypothetical protein
MTASGPSSELSVKSSSLSAAGREQMLQAWQGKSKRCQYKQNKKILSKLKPMNQGMVVYLCQVRRQACKYNS